MADLNIKINNDYVCDLYPESIGGYLKFIDYEGNFFEMDVDSCVCYKGVELDSARQDILSKEMERIKSETNDERTLGVNYQIIKCNLLGDQCLDVLAEEQKKNGFVDFSGCKDLDFYLSCYSNYDSYIDCMDEEEFLEYISE